MSERGAAPGPNPPATLSGKKDVAKYPEPTHSATNRALVEAWQRGEVVLQHCGACSAVIFFPREMCPKCWSTALEWRNHSGHGHVVSYSRIYSHVTEPFVNESPVTLAEIELEGGGAMLARVIAADEIKTGSAVELVPKTDAARYSLPTFRLRK
jgi:uncharacterized OB-fold protein